MTERTVLYCPSRTSLLTPDKIVSYRSSLDTKTQSQCTFQVSLKYLLRKGLSYIIDTFCYLCRSGTKAVMGIGNVLQVGRYLSFFHFSHFFSP